MDGRHFEDNGLEELPKSLQELKQLRMLWLEAGKGGATSTSNNKCFERFLGCSDSRMFCIGISHFLRAYRVWLLQTYTTKGPLYCFGCPIFLAIRCFTLAFDGIPLFDHHVFLTKQKALGSICVFWSVLKNGSEGPRCRWFFVGILEGIYSKDVKQILVS